jgi:hypothetical protein
MKLDKLILISTFMVLLFGAKIFAQNDAMQLGSNLNPLRQAPQGGFYDYSDPQAVNIKVAVWGWVRFPGKYIIPAYATVNDLLSFAGGPTDAAHLENLKIMRMNEDSTQTIIKVKYSDMIMMSDESTTSIKSPSLLPNDVLIVAGEPRYYFRDYFSMALSVVSVIVSLATLIVVYARK